MKRLIAVVSALVCVLALSVSAFAAFLTPISTGIVVDDGDYYRLKCVVQASAFNAEQSAFWSDFVSAVMGQSSDMATISADSSGGLQLYLFRSGTYTVSYSSDGRSLWVDVGSSKAGNMAINGSTGALISYRQAGGYLTVCNSTGNYLFWGVSKLSNVPSALRYVDWDKRLMLVDDLEPEPEPEPEPTPSEPETPSSSQGGWTPPTVADPEIPQGDEYVFYDTTVLKHFLDFVRNSIGQASNVGWLIFGFILLWLIVKKVIKSFSSR